jgi:DNA-directed RNA polymerase specialized sigma24 family protein
MPEVDLLRSHADFQTTSWTVLEALRAGSPAERNEAIETLIHCYFPAVYAYLVRSGRRRDEAAELTQAFFADVVLSRRLFECADDRKGRLRTILLTALQRFVIDQHRRKVARAADRRLSLESLGAEEAFLSQHARATPEEVYDRRVAIATLQQAIDRCEEYFTSKQKVAHWQAFSMAEIRPAVAGVENPPLSVVAKETGFASAAHVASAFKVVRKHLQICLREVIAETTASSEDQEAEFEYLTGLLS